MAFNPKLCSIPIVTESDNIGMPDLPILLPRNARFTQHFMGSSCSVIYTEYKGGLRIGTTYSPAVNSVSITLSADIVKLYLSVGTTYQTLNFAVEPPIYDLSQWCRISAWDSTRYNYSSYPITMYFRANTRKIEQQNVVVKYDDEVGTIIPLSQKQFDVLTFTTMPMNADYARLLLDIAEWDNVTFQYWDARNNRWLLPAIKVVKKAEAWQKTTYPKTLGTTIQGSFVIKQ